MQFTLVTKEFIVSRSFKFTGFVYFKIQNSKLWQCVKDLQPERLLFVVFVFFFINIPRGSLLVVTTNLKLMANSMNWTSSCLLSAKFEVFHSALLCFRLFSFAFFQYFESVPV